MERKKLSEYNSIETWKQIAYYVQRLKLKNNDTNSFHENVMKLQKLLENTPISLETGARVPTHKEEIGLATLLHEIYESGVGKHYRKANFYEKIYQLCDLKIDKIAFSPLDSDLERNFTDLNLVEPIFNEYVEKVYTDGTFDLNVMNNNNTNSYDMNILKEYSYLLKYFLRLPKTLEEKGVIGLAVLQNFQGIYPSVDEVFSTRQPRVQIPLQTIENGSSIKVTLQFDRFDIDEASYQKRLTRTKNNEYYYKEYKK